MTVPPGWKSPRRIDLIGQRFGRLTVIDEAALRETAGGQKRRHWICRCDCGAITTPSTGQLRSGNSRSCGCLKRDATTRRNLKHGFGGSERPPEYEIWRAVRRRCTSPNEKDAPYYSDVSVCKRWDSFEAFYEDMGPRPSDKHSIDRIDPYGNYEPGNCRWATALQQRHNRREAR